MEQELQEEDDLRSRCPRTPGIPTKRTGDYSEEMLRGSRTGDIVGDIKEKPSASEGRQ